MPDADGKVKGIAVSRVPWHIRTGADLIKGERVRQMVEEAWSPRHDDDHKGGELALAAVSYATDPGNPRRLTPQFWPWSPEWWKPSDDPIQDLVKAGALIAAEIDRLQRCARA